MKIHIDINLDGESGPPHEFIKVRLEPHGDDPNSHCWADILPKNLRKVARILDATRNAVKKETA